MSTNIVKVHSLKDSSIHKDQFSRYYLSILIRRDGFAFAVLDTGLNKYVHFEAFKPVIPDNRYYTDFALQEISDHIGNQLTVLDFSKKEFGSVNVVFESNVSTLVPKKLYVEGNEKTYLEFAHNPLGKNNDHYFSNLVKIIDSYNIFTVPDQFIKILDKHFKEYSMYSQADSLICSLIKHYVTFAGKAIFVNARFREFDLLMMNNGKLAYYNTFTFIDSNDFLYYLLNYTKQNKLNPEAINLILIDDIYDDTDMYQKLSDYFRNLSFIKRNPEYHYSTAFNILPEHTYYSLFSINACV